MPVSRRMFVVLAVALGLFRSPLAQAQSTPSQPTGGAPRRNPAERVEFGYKGHTFQLTIINGEVRQVMRDGMEPLVVNGGKVVAIIGTDPKSVPIAQEALEAYLASPKSGQGATAAPRTPLQPAPAITASPEPCSLLSQTEIARILGVVRVGAGERTSAQVKPAQCKWGGTAERVPGRAEERRGITIIVLDRAPSDARGERVSGIGDEAYFVPNTRPNIWQRNSFMSMVVRGGGAMVALDLSGDGMSDDEMRNHLKELASAVAARLRNGTTTAVSAQPGSDYATVTQDQLNSLTAGNRLDFILLRHNPELLDDPAIIKQFALMNNCSAPRGSIETALANEFDRPKVLGFYRDHAAEILTGVSDAVEIGPAESTFGTNLADYEAARGVFPFRRPVTINQVHFARGAANLQCSSGGTHLVGYTLRFRNAPTLTEMRLDEAAARAFIAELGVRAREPRYVRFALSVELLNQPATHADGSFANEWTLDADIRKVVVVSAQTGKPLTTIRP